RRPRARLSERLPVLGYLLRRESAQSRPWKNFSMKKLSVTPLLLQRQNSRLQEKARIMMFQWSPTIAPSMRYHDRIRWRLAQSGPVLGPSHEHDGNALAHIEIGKQLSHYQ